MAHSDLVQVLRTTLGPELRRPFDRTYESLLRELRYIAVTRPANLERAAANNWSRSRLETVIALNVFYRIAVRPISASSVIRTSVGLVEDTPIKHGETVLDRARAARIRAASEDFAALVKAAQIPHRWLEVASAGDIVYRAERLSSDEQ